MFTYSLNSTVLSLESTLRLDYKNTDVISDILDSAVQRIESAYGLEIDRPLDLLISESGASFTQDAVMKFQREVHSALKDLSFLVSMTTFTKHIPMSLADVNYFGFASDKLLTYFKYLLDSKLYDAHHNELVEPFKTAVGTVPFTYPKRLMVLLLMFERLGIKEGVCLTAQCLLLGGYE